MQKYLIYAITPLFVLLTLVTLLIVSGVNMSYASMLKSGILEGVCFIDENENGIHDEDETEGAEGVMIVLKRRRSVFFRRWNEVDRTVTGPDGEYRFTVNRHGVYIVQSIGYPDYELTTENARKTRIGSFYPKTVRDYFGFINSLKIDDVLTAELTADPLSITASDSSTLCWSAQNVDNVFLNGGIGIEDPDGCLEVFPEQTSTYTLIADDDDELKMASVTIVVVPAPLPQLDYGTDGASDESGGSKGGSDGNSSEAAPPKVQEEQLYFEDSMNWIDEICDDLIESDDPRCMPTFAEEILMVVKSGNGNVVVKWTAVSETNVLGYNILRAQGLSNTYQKINPNFIAAKGSPELTVEYKYIDSEAVNGIIYRYMLEELEITGPSKDHGPVYVLPRILK